MAEFETPSALVEAAERARLAGYRNMDAYSPIPIEELNEALGLRRTRLPMLVLAGGLIGGLCAALLSIFPIAGLAIQQGAVLAMIACGGLFGIFMSTMIGSSVPNSKLARFAADLEQGRVLLMVDVPLYRVDAVRELLERRHPEASWSGVDPSIPAFP